MTKKGYVDGGNEDSKFQIQKLPPQALDIEMAILGGILTDSNCMHEVVELLKGEEFYCSKNKTIYSAILSLYKNSWNIDILTCVQELKKINKLDFVGGATYITQLTSKIGSATNIEFHCRIITQKYIQRKTIESCQFAINDANDDKDVFETVDNITNLLDIVDNVISGSHKTFDIKSLVLDSEKRYLKRKEASESNQFTGVPTGLSSLNKLTGGWQNSDLVIWASRPAMGKTAYLCYNARESAKNGFTTVVFSLEMSAPQLIDRMIQGEAGDINPEDYKFGNLDTKSELLVAQARNRIESLPLIIDDAPRINPTQILARLRKHKKVYGDKMICFIDYLQIMDAGSDKRYNNREQEVSSIARSLKSIAKKINIPIIALAQLSRQAEQRGGSKKPQLSDLRESGAIEQEADIVMFLYRSEYYGILTDEAGNSLEGVGELLISKHRNGATTRDNDIQFCYNKSITKISDPINNFTTSFSYSSDKPLKPNKNFYEVEKDDDFTNVAPF